MFTQASIIYLVHTYFDPFNTMKAQPRKLLLQAQLNSMVCLLTHTNQIMFPPRRLSPNTVDLTIIVTEDYVFAFAVHV